MVTGAGSWLISLLPHTGSRAREWEQGRKGGDTKVLKSISDILHPTKVHLLKVPDLKKHHLLEIKCTNT